MKHIPVLQKEVIDLMNIKEDSNYIDVTLGSGGHSRLIAQCLNGGKLLAIDYSIDSVDLARETLRDEIASGTVLVLQGNFKDVKEIAGNNNLENIQGIVADLGWSTDQLESADGLSYLKDEAQLDMRLDQSLGVQAKDLLNALGVGELEKLLINYADISKRKSRQMAIKAVELRKIKPFEVVKDLKNLVQEVFRKDDYSLYSKIFQAFRIAVNDEFTNLKEFLKSSMEILSGGGRLLVITFHSGEEDIVHFLFNKYEKKGVAKYVLEDKYVQPNIDELKENINSRSAKLWVIEKL